MHFMPTFCLSAPSCARWRTISIGRYQRSTTGKQQISGPLRTQQAGHVCSRHENTRDARVRLLHVSAPPPQTAVTAIIIPQGISVVLAEGTILSACSAACRLTRYYNCYF